MFQIVQFIEYLIIQKTKRNIDEGEHFGNPSILAKLLKERFALYHKGKDIEVQQIQELINSLCWDCGSIIVT